MEQLKCVIESLALGQSVQNHRDGETQHRENRESGGEDREREVQDFGGL